MIALRNPVTVAVAEFAMASSKKLMPDTATHSKSILGRKGAASVSQVGYDSAAMS